MSGRSNLYTVVTIGGGLVLLAIAGWLWFGYEGPQNDIALKPDDAKIVSRGQAIYEAECASCHGDNLEGQPDWRQRQTNGRLPAPPHDADGHTWHHPDKQLFELTKFGPAALVGDGYESDMPGYHESLSDEDIVAALSYIKSTWPPEVRQRHDLLNGRQRKQSKK
jgi:mono/diheme cytochrome c family protein